MAIVDGERTPGFKPRCPNHNVELDGLPWPLPRKGEGICPISKCHFSFEVEVDEEKLVKDKNGNMVPTVGWSVNGEEDDDSEDNNPY